MELAVITFLAEAKRRKRAIFGTADKKTLFVSRLNYPLWAIPWGNQSLILDGLDAFSVKTNQNDLPDVEKFLDDVEDSKTRRNQFHKTVETHQNTFREFAKTDQAQFNSLIADAELLAAIHECVKEALEQEAKKQETVVLVPLAIGQTTAIENAKLIMNVHKKVQTEIETLEQALRLLGETAQFHEQMILKEAESIKDTYEAEISRIRPAIEKKLDQLEKERDARIAKMNRTTENDLKTREREREKCESELQKLVLNKANYERRLETRKKRHDKIGATYWERRVKVDENKIREIRSRIRSLTEYIEKMRKQNESDVEKLRFAYQDLLDREKRKISEVEFQRDEKVEAKQQEIDLLRNETREITSQLGRLIAKKREQETEIGKLAVPLNFDEATLICVPFYIVCYRAGKTTQFEIFPPVKLVSSAGFVKTLQETIRSLRPTSGFAAFSQPMSRPLSNMLCSVLGKRMKSGKEFNENLLKTASSNSILDRQDLRQALKKGVEELRIVGLISSRQGDTLLKTYARQ
jgi:hypothetical protein